MADLCLFLEAGADVCMLDSNILIFQWLIHNPFTTNETPIIKTSWKHDPPSSLPICLHWQLRSHQEGLQDRPARQALQCTVPGEPRSSFRESKKLAATWCPWRSWVLNRNCQTVPECLLRKQLLLYSLWLPPVPSKITSGLSHQDRMPYFFLQDVK